MEMGENREGSRSGVVWTSVWPKHGGHRAFFSEIRLWKALHHTLKYLGFILRDFLKFSYH